MAVCDWDMCFIFALRGWEGTAHDAREFDNVNNSWNELSSSRRYSETDSDFDQYEDTNIIEMENDTHTSEGSTTNLTVVSSTEMDVLRDAIQDQIVDYCNVIKRCTKVLCEADTGEYGTYSTVGLNDNVFSSSIRSSPSVSSPSKTFFPSSSSSEYELTYITSFDCSSLGGGGTFPIIFSTGCCGCRTTLRRSWI
ncbi:hypothetical protein PIB30_009912, partial [Stylosanthes scabra]|nr:hypothetical protein [Stylosanthes scabra]